MSLIKNLLSFLKKSDLPFIVLLVLMMVSTAIIEFVGIGLLFPYIKILSDPHFIHDNHFLNKIYDYLKFSSERQFLLFLGIFILLMVVLKGIMNVINIYAQSRLTHRIAGRLSECCITEVMSLSYEKLIEKNSALSSKKLLVDVSNIVFVLHSFLTIMADVMVSIFLIALLVMISPGIVLVVFGSIVLLLFFTVSFTKKSMRQLSISKEYCERQSFQTAAEAFRVLKEAKVYHLESYFITRCLQWRHQLSRHVIGMNVIGLIPSNILSVSGFAALLVIILYLISQQGGLNAILPTIGLLVVSLQRFLPLASRISDHIGIIRQYIPSVDTLAQIILKFSKTVHSTTAKKDSNKKRSFNNKLVLSHISYRYPGQQNYALKEVSFTIERGKCFGIVGESGAGKSTLVDLLLGLLPAESGSVYWDEQKVVLKKNSFLSRGVSYVPQRVFLLDATILENIILGIDPAAIDETLLNRAIAIAQLGKFLQDQPRGLDTIVGEGGVKISGGERQRIGIARALYRNHEVIILDEATNALDGSLEKEFNDHLKALLPQKTIIIIAHRISAVSLCDQIIQLEKGRIIASGSYQHLASSSASFRRIYNLAEID